jgi:hypothetical protein
MEAVQSTKIRMNTTVKPLEHSNRKLKIEKAK